MDHALTVRDLLMPGAPLYLGETLAGESRLGNAVSWVVSLRPYSPALPGLQGGELVLVIGEYVARMEPPTTLLTLLGYLASREASGVAVRGEVDSQAVEAARQLGLPLIHLPPDAPLHDIEQAIMRECALHQARREVLPAENPSAWVDDLLAGRITSTHEAQSRAKRAGHILPTHYTVAYLFSVGSEQLGLESVEGIAQELGVRVGKQSHGSGQQGALSIIIHPHGEGLVVLLPAGAAKDLVGALWGGPACGIGGEKPLLEVPASLAEAQLAATASAFLYACAPTHYNALGADRLLLLLRRDHPGELAAFVEATIGPLLRHDRGSPVPLLPTLRLFLEHGGRLRETAASIPVHRNTLSYRLERAAEILGADLKDPTMRLSIELALRAWPLLGLPLSGRAGAGQQA